MAENDIQIVRPHPKGDWYAVTKAITDLGGHINVSDRANENFWGTLYLEGLYYGYGNPHTSSYTTSVSPQLVKAFLDGADRSVMYDLAEKYGASVLTRDVRSVAYGHKTLFFNLKDGRSVQFMPHPASDPDLYCSHNKEALEATAEAMASFDWNDAHQWDSEEAPADDH